MTATTMIYGCVENNCVKPIRYWAKVIQVVNFSGGSCERVLIEKAYPYNIERDNFEDAMQWALSQASAKSRKLLGVPRNVAIEIQEMPWEIENHV